MKSLKKIITFILTVCMIVSMFSLCSCKKNKGDGNGDTNDKNTTQTTDKTYTVTIVGGDNTPVEGVKLIITDSKKFETVTTDANGKASAKLPEGTVSVMISGELPSGYEKPDKVSAQYHGVFASGSTELTIALKEKATNKVTYTITVTDTNGDPVVGMQIQLCPDGLCLPDKFYTNEFGEITAQITPGKVVDVKLYNLEGYTLPAAVKGEYHASIPADETEITIDNVTKN